MNSPTPGLYGLFLCFFFINSCGPTEGSHQQNPVKNGGGVVEDEVVRDANLFIETTLPYGGLSDGCRCDGDNAYGYGGTSKLLTNDGVRPSWQGCWRGGSLSDPNRGIKCSTGGEYVYTIEPNRWAIIKKELLSLKLQNSAGSYGCHNTSSPCIEDSGRLTHEIIIDDKKFYISYNIENKYLPPNLQRFDLILRSLDEPQSD